MLKTCFLHLRGSLAIHQCTYCKLNYNIDIFCITKRLFSNVLQWERKKVVLFERVVCLPEFLMLVSTINVEESVCVECRSCWLCWPLVNSCSVFLSPVHLLLIMLPRNYWLIGFCSMYPGGNVAPPWWILNFKNQHFDIFF